MWKFTLTLGALIRRKVISEIKSACFRYDLDIDVQESKGLLESDYLIKISGDSDKVERLKTAMGKWFKSLED